MASTIRRAVTFGVLPALIWMGARATQAAKTTSRKAPFDYPYRDYWDSEDRVASAFPEGIGKGLEADIKRARNILDAAPTDSALAIMNYFADLPDVSTGGEPFNARWKWYENPVIVWFFHSTHMTPAGDCTSWCAAFMSWCIERCGKQSKHTVSAIEYADFGIDVTVPIKGDIVVFRDKLDPSHGHVALYLRGDETSLEIIGGNQSGTVQVPNCPAGYPITKIGRAWWQVKGARLEVLCYRRIP